MTPQMTATAQQCLDGSYAGALSFPETVRRLMEAGFEGYSVDFRRSTRIYYTPDGESLALDNPVKDDAVAPDFDQPGVAQAIKWAQASPPDYSYVGFNKKVTALGCAGYHVSFSGRRVVYYGRTGDLHIEHFPR